MSTPATHHGIAVGVDGSPPSKVAVDWAAREASLWGLPLTLIHVIRRRSRECGPRYRLLMTRSGTS